MPISSIIHPVNKQWTSACMISEARHLLSRLRLMSTKVSDVTLLERIRARVCRTAAGGYAKTARKILRAVIEMVGRYDYSPTEGPRLESLLVPIQPSAWSRVVLKPPPHSHSPTHCWHSYPAMPSLCLGKHCAKSEISAGKGKVRQKRGGRSEGIFGTSPPPKKNRIIVERLNGCSSGEWGGGLPFLKPAIH